MRSCNRRTRALAVALLGFGMLTSSNLGASADTSDQLHAIRAQEANEKAALQSLKGQERALAATLARLTADLASHQQDFAELTSQAATLALRIGDLETQEQRLEAIHQSRLRSFRATMRHLYKSSPAGEFAYVFDSQDFGQFIDRMISMVRVAHFNADEATRLKEEKDQLAADRRHTAELRAGIDPLLDEIARQSAAVSSEVGTQQAAVSGVEAAQRAQLAALIGHQQQEQQLEAALAAQAAAASAAAQKAQQGGGQAYGSSCPQAPTGKVSFCGHGFGHGVGLAQYGALGMAQAGSSWQAIVDHFYTGASIAQAPAQTVRAWLTGAGATVTPAVASTIEDVAGATLGAVAPNQRVSFVAQADGSVVARWGTSQARGKPLRLVPAAGGLFAAGGRHYRGEAWADGSSGLKVINHVSLEDYLRGLGEVPSSWPLAAVQAQSVAARTYALYHLGGGRAYDVDDTTAYQVYLGSDRETTNQDRAVASTAGSGLLVGGHFIDAVFSSSDGGHSQCASSEWGSTDNPCSPSYLQGVIDNYDVSPLHTWYTPPFTLVDIQRFLGRAYNAATCGALTGFDLSDRDRSDRLNVVKLVGTKGVCRLSPGAFINAFNAGSPPDAIIYGDLLGVNPGARAWPYW